MGAAADALTGKVRDDDRFDYAAVALRETQIAALDERFQERKDRIPLLKLRADEVGIAHVRSLADIVPLLLPHTAYKSYPESFLIEGRWDRLTQWLGAVSTHPIAAIDMTGVASVDDWVARLESAGHYISCSSGIGGKSAMLIASQADLEWSKLDAVGVFSWGSGIEPRQDRKMIGCAAVAAAPKNRTVSAALDAAFSNADWPRWVYPVPPITVGAITRMAVMRKQIAEGTARPEDLADFEKTTRERQEILDRAIQLTADEIIASRDMKLMLAGLWGGLHAVARAVRDKGYGGKDFNPDNCIYVGGGVKRAMLPPDYQDFVHQTFNIPEGRHFQNYSMQELNSGMPKCREGHRYHVPPWIIPLILNKEGDAILEHDGEGEITGRAAFFDLALDGRWGGIITGDRISLDYSPCACGDRGPSIKDNIARFADIEGDDKIGCAATIDAYVRGMS